MADVLDRTFGQKTIVLDAESGAWEGRAYFVQVLLATTFSAFTENLAPLPEGITAGVMTGKEIAAGTPLHNGAGITAITVASGLVRVHLD